MRSTALVLAMGLMVVAATPAFATEPTATTAVDAAPNSTVAPVTATTETSKTLVDDNKIVCRRSESTGSRLGGERVCKTQAEWTNQSRQSQADLKDLVRRSYNTNLPGG